MITSSALTNLDLRNRVVELNSPFTLAYQTNMTEMQDGASIQWSKLLSQSQVKRNYRFRERHHITRSMAQDIYFADKFGGR